MVNSPETHVLLQFLANAEKEDTRLLYSILMGLHRNLGYSRFQFIQYKIQFESLN